MQRFLTVIALVLPLAGAAASLEAQDGKPDARPNGKPVEGTLTIGKHVFKLSHAVAYQMKFADEECVSVVASDRKIPFDRIQAALKKDDGSDGTLSLDQLYVVVMFLSSGEMLSCRASGEGGSFARSGKSLTGSLSLENGRARGEANLAPEPDASIKTALALRWDVPLGAEAAAKPAARPAGPVKPSVSGTFKGNGKDAKLAFVSARRGEPFDSKPSILFVFTEKDHSKDPKPDLKAGFGQYGSALVISTFEDGKIFSCQVAHAAHRMPFSTSGTLRTASFDVADGRVEGEFLTDGEKTFFDKTWEVDIKFVAPYSAPVKTATAPPLAAQPKQGEKKVVGADSPPAKAASALKAKDLALPKDVTDAVYKKLVEQITFASAAGHKALAAEFSKKLAAQGWKSDGSDLVAAKSAILKRTRGPASLTIFVKPAEKGSTVTIMTEGLDWGEE